MNNQLNSTGLIVFDDTTYTTVHTDEPNSSYVEPNSMCSHKGILKDSIAVCDEFHEPITIRDFLINSLINDLKRCLFFPFIYPKIIIFAVFIHL